MGLFINEDYLTLVIALSYSEWCFVELWVLGRFCHNFLFIYYFYLFIIISIICYDF